MKTLEESILKEDSGNITISAIIIPLMNVMEFIQPVRSKYTEDGAKGLIPHVTIFYPFYRDKDALVKNQEKLFSLGRVITPFSFDLVKISRFEKSGVLFLDPEPKNTIIDIIHSFAHTFPDILPYDGEIPLDEINPHATIAISPDNKELDTIENKILRNAGNWLPVHVRVEKLFLVVLFNEKWYIYFDIDLEG
jgi:hypothetical protein